VKYCDRIVGLRQGHILFDVPAHEVSAAMMTALYSFSRPGAVWASLRLAGCATRADFRHRNVARQSRRLRLSRGRWLRLP
jgi:hypothetical protein